MDAPREIRYTHADLDRFDPQKRWELIDGIPYCMAGASLLHQSLVGELYFVLRAQFGSGPCRVLMAPFDVKFGEHDVVQPDLLVSCNDRLCSQFQQGPPDLVVEVLSPSSVRHDRLRKLRLYAREGVPEYWLITPHPLLVEVLKNQGGAFLTHGVYGAEHTLRSARFPDLSVDLTAVAKALPPQPPIPDEIRETAPTYA